MQVRAVEKTLRSVMAHLLRHPPLAMYSVQLNDALQRQKSRLEVSWETEQRVRRAKRAAATQGVPSGFDASAGAGPSNLGKHANAYETVDWYGAKRARVDAGTEIGSGSGKGHAVDVSGLRVDEVVEYVMAGLRGLDPATISRAFDNARSNIAQDNGDAMYDLAPVLGMADPRAGQYGQVSGVGQHGHPPGPGYGSGAGTGAGAVKEEKEEVLDPLEMDMEDDELLADDESETDEAITFANFTLPPPELPSLEERDEMIEDILKRISDSGQEMAGAAATVVAGTTDPWAWLTSASAAASSEGGGGKDGLRGIMDVKEMWMLLLSRLATRAGAIAQGDGDADEVKAEGVNGSKGEAMIREKGRRRVAEFIAGDFAARSKFAALWLNEEWYTEKLSSPTGTCPLYTSHLLSILSSHLAKLDGHSSTATSSARSLSLFLANVPQIPLELVDQLATLAEDPDRAIVGFLALRDLVESRPPVRAKALGKLLDLCVHPDRKVRVLGISTVRRWVPGHKVSVEVVGFAEKVLARLGYAQEAKLAEAGSKPEVEDGEGEEKKVDPEDAPMDGDAPADAAAARAETEETKETKPAPVELPTDLADLSHFLPAPSTSSIQQHVELPFALSRRDPSLLDNIFALYPTLPPFIQGQYEDLLVPLIQSLAVGPVAARPVPPPNAPSGPKAEVAANGTDAPTDAAPATQTPAPVPAPAPLSPSEKLMGLLREYPAEGTEKLVLRVISTLSKEGKSATVRDLVRGWVEQKGEDVDVRFVVPVLGELSRAEIEAQIPRIVTLLNTPDSRDTVRTAFATLIQKLTPADLLVALHNESTAIKPTIEAIGICFSMTTVFRSDVLVASMVRIADLPSGSLPIVFMRTIIQAVTTYKSLVPFVANTVLPKLVSKKIWSAGPQLWDGFIRLARLIAPASYGVLLQLPKEWLKDVLEKQPALKTGLKTFLAAKQGGRGVLVELFGDQA